MHKQIADILNLLPKKASKAYAEVCELSEGKAVITDGFSLMVYHNEDIKDNKTIDKNGKEKEVNFPDWQRVFDHEKKEYVNKNSVKMVDTLLRTLKPLTARYAKDHPVLKFESEELILTYINKDEKGGVYFNPYVFVQYMKAIPKGFELSSIEVDHYGAIRLVYSTPTLTEKYELVGCAIIGY